MLSREFLTQRGYCCGHGCLMCPYDPKHTKGNTKLHAKNKKNIRKENKKVSYLSLAENWLTPCMTEGVFKIKFSWKLTTEENYSSVTDKTCSFNLNFRT